MNDRGKWLGEWCDEHGVNRRDLSGLLYDGRLIPRDTCPIIGGKRWIPESVNWLLLSKLRQAGKLPKEGGNHAN